MSMIRTLFLVLAGLGFMLPAIRVSGQSQPALGTNAPLKQLGSNIFELGKVRIDKVKKSVAFPAMLNMDKGLIEYAVVTVGGKVHESLLRTEAEPLHIHLAMLLLGAKGMGTNAYPEDPRKPIQGDKVGVWISWREESGRDRRVRVEDLVMNQQTGSSATRGPWTYNGSRVFQGTFIAQQDGSIVTTMVDPDALINNPRLGRESDKIWFVNGTGLPPLNWPMQVTIELESNKANPDRE